MGAALDRRRPEPVAIEGILDRLEAVRRTSEGRWMARCPAHGDKGPSLSIRRGEDGRTLLHCHAGCTFSEVVAALSLEPWQLFPPSDRPWAPKTPRPDPEREARREWWSLIQRHRSPAPERIQRELRFIGKLLLGGTETLRAVPTGFGGSDLQWVPARLLFLAMVELARQGTPRRHLSLVALAQVIDHAAHQRGYARERGLYQVGRMAVRTCRRSRNG